MSYRDDYITLRDATLEIWKRILNNLPYLYKTKGTIRGLRAMVTCYGIPSTLLYVREFGGPDVSSSIWNEYRFDNYSYALDFIPTASMMGVWTGSNSIYNRVPSCIEFRFITTGSAYTIYTNEDTGHLQFVIPNSNDTSSLFVASTSEFPIYDNNPIHVVFQKDTASDGDISNEYHLYANKYLYGSILYAVSASLIVSASQNLYFSSHSYVNVGGVVSGTDVVNRFSNVKAFYGSIDEFRLWDTALARTTINTHTRYPQSFIGDTITASYNDLLLKYSFNNPLDVGDNTMVSIGLPNEAPSNGYEFQTTFSQFPNITVFPYQYSLYEYESEAHSINLGSSRQSSNKVRIENGTLLGPLSPTDKMEIGQYDLSQIDSNRLGIYFTPSDPVNEDMIKTLAISDPGDLIGNPIDLYNDTYSELDKLKNIYWHNSSRKIGVNDYLRYIKYYDPTLFDHLRLMVPARCHINFGIVYEQTLLERAKTKYIKPIITPHHYEQSIDMPEHYRNITSSYISTDVYYDINSIVTMSNSGYDNLPELIYYMNDVMYIVSSSYANYNLPMTIELTDYYNGLSGSIVNIIGPIVDFDHNITYEHKVKIPLSQSYIPTSGYIGSATWIGYHPSHYKYFNCFGTWEKRLKWMGCSNNESMTTDRLPAIQTWITDKRVLKSKDDGKSKLQIIN